MKKYVEKLEYIRQRTAKAEFLIKKVDDYQEMLKQINEEDMFGQPFVVKFFNNKEFVFPRNYNASIFKNILQSAIEIDVERITKELDEILS